ncbi:hypothetical protein H3H36_21325 [Duganella sp. FT3S]|uniref:Uncharacterized protein n=1 Tax=Rugamonas fusca TaxID=2758568 RepID=A0A7W2EL82_9BURK|nr:hypothetical protein [Rugamonas fusca]MBA5607902.1 hypothetical protein [Rugamonas fusca]
MDARRSETAVPPAAYRELSDYLRQSGSTLTTTEAIVRALQHWMAAQRETRVPLQGYQWKCLFLPEGSQVRMRFGDTWHYAEVMGDEIMYRSRVVSPRQLTMAIAGDGRNAWRDLWIRRPGERDWTAAYLLRRRMEQQAIIPPASPMEAMRAAAGSMSDALKTALTLVNHVSLHAENQVERRLPKHRRVEDFMIDDCKRD